MSDTFLAVGAPCGGSHYVKYILNQMGVKCTLERPTPGKSLVQWTYATGYNVYEHHDMSCYPYAPGDEAPVPPHDALFEDNYNEAREKYSHIIHYTRNPFDSIPCLSHEFTATPHPSEAPGWRSSTSHESYIRKTVINSVRDKKPNFWYTPWLILNPTVVESVLDFWYRWHKLILSKKPDITIQIEKFDKKIYDFIKDKTPCNKNFSIDKSNHLDTGSRKSLPGRKSHEEETQIFIDEILPSINICLLKEVVKLGHQFGYTFPEEVVIRCK